MLLFISLAGLMQVAKSQLISIENVQLATANGEFRLVELPLKRNLRGDFQVRLEIHQGSSSTSALRIIPDDRILAVRLNGVPVSLAGIPESDRHNYMRGFEIKLHGLIPNEINILELQLNNVSGVGGLNIESGKNLNGWGILSAFVALLTLVVALIRYLPISKAQGVLLVLALLVSLLYLSVTNSYTRTFDVYEGGGHRDYIYHLIEHRSMPHPGDGWEYHQPPLYYTIAALTKAGLVGADVTSDFWGQLLALYFWTIFLVASLATLRIAFRSSRLALLIASAALCLWPSGIIHSVRIGNDIPLYAFYGLAFYYIVKWWQVRHFSSLMWAGVWASLALLTKSNALAIWAVLGVLFIVYAARSWRARMHKPHEYRKAWRGAVFLGCFFVMVLLLNLGNNVWHYLEGTSSDWLLSNVSATINPKLQVGNAPVNYLVFDLPTYLTEPFISTWDDRYGRQYFWNFVWRSALSSEFFFNGAGAVFFNSWGIANGVFLLLLLAGILLYGVQQKMTMSRRQLLLAGYRSLPWLLALVFPFLLLLAYRIKVPLSSNTDFRYIYPVLLVLLFLAARAWAPGTYYLAPRLLTLGAPLIAISSLLWVGILTGLG
jgi:hypothetical protein